MKYIYTDITANSLVLTAKLMIISFDHIKFNCEFSYKCYYAMIVNMT